MQRVRPASVLSIVRSVCALPPTAVYFLSNNHVNDLISSRVDPTEEELVAYYISFLKTLSLWVGSVLEHDFPLPA